MFDILNKKLQTSKHMSLFGGKNGIIIINKIEDKHPAQFSRWC